MNKKSIVEAIYGKIGLPKRETAAIVDTAFELIKRSLAGGEPVVISSFGRFSVRERKPRKGRNPQTGEAITIPARKVVTFKPSQVLKERINDTEGDRDTR
ncbi:MAG: integration host factor subunit alpha [Deltaproteobacteria bacterium]|nr:MAG: integration host factor subunit alpha [Deltaproteobacteria bacterium]RLB91205.1 MAG: integration host factor subunit alpha [Deltaproteobacteria bacterium]RLC09370.1 MAG: integration host factor subunit alpha [Deltaproteobacteria bacterium]